MALKDHPTEELTDTKGRKILVRPLNVVQQMRKAKAMGPYQSSNQGYDDYVSAACCAVSIDGVSLGIFPRTEQHIEQRIEKLEDEGTVCVMTWMLRRAHAMTQAMNDAAAAAEEANQAAPDGEGDKDPVPLPSEVSATS